jgi:hypothetical protein
MRRLGLPRSRLRASSATGHAVTVVLGLVLLSGAVAGTSASFSASTSNGSTLGTDSLNAPATMTAAASGNNVVIGWSAGSMESGAPTFGHRVRERALGVEAGTRDGQDPPACATTDTFTATATTDNVTLTTTDTGVATSTNQGSWYCYTVDTQYPQGASPLWFSQAGNQVVQVQLGHVVRSLQFVDGPDVSANTFSEGDAVVITFSQPVNIATGPTNTNNPTGIPTSGDSFCIRKASSTLNIGRTAFGNCGNNEDVDVGKLAGLTIGGRGSTPAYHATWSWTGCAVAGQCTTLTGLVGMRYRDNDDNTVAWSSSSIFVASPGDNVSATGGLDVCAAANDATQTCMPSPFGTV